LSLSLGDFRNSWIFPQVDVLYLLPSHRRARVRVRLAIYHVRQQSFTKKPLRALIPIPVGITLLVVFSVLDISRPEEKFIG